MEAPQIRSFLLLAVLFLSIESRRVRHSLAEERTGTHYLFDWGVRGSPLCRQG